MADEIDRAQAYDQFYRDLALASHRYEPASAGVDTCEDCGEEIPEARRRAMPGCRRCIDCQTTLENWRPL